MARKVVRRERRKRGFFGWFFLLLFIAFNALMVVWLMSYWGKIADMSTDSDAELVGAAIGTAVGTGMLVFFWVAGDVILGLFALLTRGRVTIVEEID